MPVGAVGFVGLGHMGLQMTLRLLSEGVEVFAFDLNPVNVEAAAAAGAKRCSSVREVADCAPVVCLSLPRAEALAAVTGGEGGLLGGAACRHVLDLSTVGPEAAREAASLMASHGIVYVEAPVSGGPAKCRAGTLSIMLAGPPEGITATGGVLALLAAKQTVVGPDYGAAQAMKLVNNLVGLAQFALVGEGLVLAAKMGIDPSIATEILNSGVAHSFVLDVPTPQHVLTRKFSYGFAVGLTLKDLYLAREMAQRNAVDTPFGDAAIACFERTEKALGAAADVTAVVVPMEQRSGVIVGSKS